MLTLHQIHKTLPGANGKDEPLFQGLSATLETGSFTGVIGPSGAGKSSLLRLINKLDSLDGGSITFQGKHMDDYPVLQLRKQIGLVFQQSVMLEGTVRDNIRVGPQLHGEGVDEEQLKQWMQDMDLDPKLLDREARELSGGQQQRVSLLRTLVLKPKLLLLDEITSALDEKSKRIVEQYVMHLHQQEGLTILWVTHDLSQLKRFMTDYWFIQDGQLIEQGTTAQLFAAPSHPLTQQFTAQGV